MSTTNEGDPRIATRFSRNIMHIDILVAAMPDDLPVGVSAKT